MKKQLFPAIILFSAFAEANKLAGLQQKRASKIEAQKKIIDAMEASEERKFTEDQDKIFRSLNGEISALDAEIAQEKEVIEAKKRAAELDGVSKLDPKKRSGKEGGEKREKSKIFLRASLKKAIRFAQRGQVLTGAEKEMNDIAIEESKRAGVEIPDNAILNIPMGMRASQQTVSQDSGDYGGQLVVDQAPRVQMPFAPQTFLEKLGAIRLSGLTGGSIPLPSASNYKMDYLSETAAITPQKKEFDGPKLEPKRVGGAVDISNRLLIQSSVNVENLIRRLIFAAYDRALNDAAINGSGGDEPTGILNISGIPQSVKLTARGDASREIVSELKALVKQADAPGISYGYLMSPELEDVLQNIKVDSGSGRFLMEQEGNLLGYNAQTSSLVPDLSDGDNENKVLIFGDWSQLFIGEWGSISILPDPYSASLANSVRLVLNAHNGVSVAHKEAFAFNKFLK